VRAPAPAPRLEPTPTSSSPRPSIRDPIGLLIASTSDLVGLAWTQANWETGLLKYAVGPLIYAGYWAWDTLFKTNVAVKDLGAVTFGAMGKLWDLAIRPPLIRLYNGLLNVWDLVRDPLYTVTKGLRWLVDLVHDHVVPWLSDFRGAVAALPSALKAMGPLFTSLAFVLEGQRFVAETRARDSVSYLIGKYNRAVDWLNLLLDGSGLVRESVFVFSAWAYQGDLLRIAVASLIREGLEAALADLEEEWKEAALPALVADFKAGNVRARKELDAAIAAFKAAA